MKITAKIICKTALDSDRTVLALAILGDTPLTKIILFVSHRPTQPRQVQTLSLSLAFLLGFFAVHFAIVNASLLSVLPPFSEFVEKI